VRLKDGRSRLYEDVFALSSLNFMPHGVSALLVMFCRNHNVCFSLGSVKIRPLTLIPKYIADKLLRINEASTFFTPPPNEPNKRAERDDEIFNKARLINCGHYLNIILRDYLGELYAYILYLSLITYVLTLLCRLIYGNGYAEKEMGTGTSNRELVPPTERVARIDRNVPIAVPRSKS
jgi:hypothetical protein